MTEYYHIKPKQNKYIFIMDGKEVKVEFIQIEVSYNFDTNTEILTVEVKTDEKTT